MPIKHERPIRPCKECGDQFRVGRSDQVFCEAKCRDRWWHRARTRGGEAYEALVGWRVSRGTDKRHSISELARIVDIWIDQDKLLGRATKGV